MHGTNEKINYENSSYIFFFFFFSSLGKKEGRFLINKRISRIRWRRWEEGRRRFVFSVYLIIRGGTIVGELRAKMWHAMAQLCRASGNDKDVFDRRARIWLCKRDRLRKSTPPSCETSNYYVTFLPGGPSASAFVIQNIHTKFPAILCKYEIWQLLFPPPPTPSGVCVCKAVSGFVNYFGRNI